MYGKKNACSELNLAGRTDLWNFRAACQAALGRQASRRQVERLHEEYLRHLPFYVRAAVRRDAYVLPPGIKTLLKALDGRKDVLLGLGTGNMERGARIKLEPSGLNGYFRFGGFGSDSLHRQVLLRKAVRRAQALAGRPVDPADVFVIGDTPLDVAAGKKAGYRTVAVGTGFATWYSLVEARPDFLARDFRGVKKWLNWFGIKS